MVPKIMELKGIAKSTTGWDLSVDSKSDKIKIETKKSIRGIIMARSQGPIDYSPMDIFRCLYYKPFKHEWDANTEHSEFSRKIGVNAYHYYMKSKKKFVVASRDFLVNMIFNVEEDGTVIICGSTDNCTLDIPEKPNTIRGKTAMSGWVIAPS